MACLIDGVVVDLRGPDNGTGPDQRQGKPDGSSGDGQIFKSEKQRDIVVTFMISGWAVPAAAGD